MSIAKTLHLTKLQQTGQVDLKDHRMRCFKTISVSASCLLILLAGVLSTSQAAAQSISRTELTQERTGIESLDPWRFTAGIGVGSLYSTAGINVGMHNSNSLAVLSVGCGGGSSLNGCHESFLVGYYRAGLFGSGSDKHAFGMWAGQTDSSAYRGVENSNRSPSDRTNLDFDPVWGLGIGYAYFHNGIGNSGPVFGLGYQKERGDNHSRDGRFQLSIGFQFF